MSRGPTSGQIQLMSKKRPPLVKGEIYHIVTRGVGDTAIFHNKDDHYRAIFSLYEFNDSKSVTIKDRRKIRLRAKKRGIQDFSAQRKLLVEILAFCLMPNHIHLLLRELRDGGIVKFIQKFGTGYAVYFNKKNSRKGHLFGKFHAVPIKDDRQLQTVFVYIHANPISIVEPKWKELGIKSPKKVIKFLEDYKWSSYADYIGYKNFPSLTERSFLEKVMGGKEGCRDFLESWVQYKKKFPDWNKVSIE